MMLVTAENTVLLVGSVCAILSTVLIQAWKSWSHRMCPRTRALLKISTFTAAALRAAG